jgi:hypothetical protein
VAVGGSGGSQLEAVCRTGEREIPEKSVTIDRAEGAEDLNKLAAALARRFELSDYLYDD